MLFDSHAHLNFPEFKNDLEAVIQRCQNEKTWINNVGSDYKTSATAIEIAEKYWDGPKGPRQGGTCGVKIFASIGLHPTNIKEEKFDFQKYLKLASNQKVVAIGETGLDYYRILNIKNQKEVFIQHIELAKKLKKPLIIHCRNAHNDLIEILYSKSHILNSPTGVIHCFSGNIKQAQRYLEMGFYLGFTGIITYSQSYDPVIKETPLEKILIETDCPYLAPIPFRHQRNEPIYVKYVAQKIAEIKNLDLETVAEQTFKNACELFRI